MNIYCRRFDCKFCDDGDCKSNVICLDEDGECEDYESYLDQKEWKTPFWKRLNDKNNNRVCRVKYYGKEIEIDGRKFYVDSKSDYAIVTDGETGFSCGQRIYLEERFEKIVEKAKDIKPLLEELPIATYDYVTQTFTYESEVEGE